MYHFTIIIIIIIIIIIFLIFYSKTKDYIIRAILYAVLKRA